MAIISMLALPDALAAQGQTTGAIKGTVLSVEGEPLPGATVIVRNVNTGTERRVQTNAEGHFSVPLLRPGKYVVRAEYALLQPVEVGPFTVVIGESRVITVRMRPLELEGIEVVAQAADVDASQTGVIETIGPQQIGSLPVAGRDFTDFVALSGLVSPQPAVGTGGQISIGGARTTGTNLVVDGANANNAFFGGNRGSARIPFAFSLSAVKEFQIITNGYDVVYGNYTGGVINVITRHGTNEFQGSVFLYGRGAALTADNFDGTPPVDYSSYQFGGFLSGPIIEDELHYFVSADIQQRDQPTFALYAPRADATTAEINEFVEILENEYGLNASARNGIFTETKDEVALFGRLDWTINSGHRAMVRVNYTNFDNLNDRVSPAGNEALTVGGSYLDEAISVVGELNSILNDEGTLYNVFRLHYSYEDRPRPANSYLPSVSVDVAEGSLTYGSAFFGILFANRLTESKIQITDNLTWQVGEHTFKIGTDNTFTHLYNKFWLNGNGFFTFDNLEDFRNRSPSFFFRLVPAKPGTDIPDRTPEPPVAEFDVREYSIYAQDAWHPTDQLLLRFGLRYGLTQFPDAGQPLSHAGFREALAELGRQVVGEPVSTTTVPEDWNNLSPRFSFSYEFEGEAESLLRGGMGVFYGRVPGVLHGNVLISTPNPLLGVICIAGATPEFDYASFKDKENIPARCREGYNDLRDGFYCCGGPNGFGIGILGVPGITVWDEDFEFPTAFKANLGYERQIGDEYKIGVQALFSRTWNNYTVEGLDIQPAQFETATGRPVHVAEEDYNPTEAASPRAFGITNELRRVYFQTSEGVARAINITLDLEGRPTENFRFSASYTYNHAFDNSSFICCTANAGLFDVPTFGNPNFLGGIGAEERGTWGPSAFERRHVIVGTGIWELPYDIQFSLIYRAQSGNPFTPEVSGDLNADGGAENDRPFLPDPDNPTAVQFASTEDLQQYREIVAENECLQEYTGEIIPRNRCRNPWFHGLDVKISKSFDTFGDQELQVIVDIFNVLDGLGLEAGEFVYKDDDLFRVEGYDPATNEVILSTLSEFGEEIPVGFQPFQFQAQLGVRYTF